MSKEKTTPRRNPSIYHPPPLPKDNQKKKEKRKKNHTLPIPLNIPNATSTT
jgi:hypothetical protein